jgi:hypothetical protein
METSKAPSIIALLTKLSDQNTRIEFTDVMQVITEQYLYTPSRFTNGDVTNEAGTNEGSCKLFSFAKMHNLTEQQTLDCFGIYYRDDVLNHPDGDDHGNIRNFIKTGWSGITFDSDSLVAKV